MSALDELAGWCSMGYGTPGAPCHSFETHPSAWHTWWYITVRLEPGEGRPHAGPVASARGATIEEAAKTVLGRLREAWGAA